MSNTKREGHSVMKTSCGGCLAQGGLLIHKENGKAVKIEGDPDHLINHGIICNRAKYYLERVYHPDRVRYPMRRTGKRGEDKWQRISLDEALGIIADKLTQAKEKHGPESLWVHSGYGKPPDWVLERFLNAFNIPNYTNPGPVCMVARMFGSMFTCGSPMPVPEFDYPPACIVMWGCGHGETRVNDAQNIRDAVEKGSSLIVIDPRGTEFAQKANIWIKVRPGSDLALVLGMLNVVITEGLFDKDFVENHTIGFDDLKELVKEYPPEKVAKITWVPAETIKETARLYATTKPAVIAWGNALEQGINAFQTMRAIAILRAITGNMCIPGGDLIIPAPPVMSRWDPAVSLANLMLPEVKEKSLWKGLYMAAPPQLLVKAILEDNPHIEVGYINGGNLLTMAPNAKKTYEALQKIPFLVVVDFFITPTSALADIVLPSATFLEYDFVQVSNYYPLVSCQQKVIEPIGESWPDHKIVNELAKKVGLGEHFWENTDVLLDVMLGKTGVTFEEFRKTGFIYGSKGYKQYETVGFPTPSKKIEIYSERLEKMGYPPLPVYKEPPESPISKPELTKEYPLVFTNYKSEKYRHSQDKNLPSLRAMQPNPLVELHPSTAGGLGIKDGDWVYIENKQGRIKQQAKLVTGIDPRIVIADWAWWYPEKGPTDLYGWDESNINVLVNGEPPFAQEIGSWDTKGFPCKVYKA